MEGKEGKRNAGAIYGQHIFPSSSFSRAHSASIISLFSSQPLIASARPCLGGSVRLSSSLAPNLGVVADGGGGRVRMVVAMVGG